MKINPDLNRFFIAALALCLLSACATSSQTHPAESLLISEKGVGAVKLGMTPAEVKAKLGADYRIIPPARTNPVEMAAWYRVIDSNNEVVWKFLVRDWQQPNDQSPIGQIRTTKKGFRTTGGVGPGSSIASAQKEWGEATLKRKAGGLGGEEVIFEKQPKYFSFTARGNGTAHAGIYGPIAAENFTLEPATQKFWGDAQIYSVIVKRTKPFPVATITRPRPAVVLSPAPGPRMRARVPTLITE